MYAVHIFLDNKKIMNQRIEHLPRTGDTIRFQGERYGVVTEVVWCFDEPSERGTRINLRVETEKDDPRESSTNPNAKNHRKDGD